MIAPYKKNKIIFCRVTEEEESILKEMASIERRSINNFIISSALLRKNELYDKNKKYELEINT